MSKALVLHSGGLDSTVCLLLARELGHEVTSLGIDYGQRHRVELEFARIQCQRFGFERRLIRVEWDKPERPLPTDRSVSQMRASVSPAFLPGRNVVFLAIACAETAGIGADEVWLGVNAIDFSGYPDCTPQFVDAFRAMIDIAIPSGPKVMTPLIDFPKTRIAQEARRLGIGPADTWSCYRPQASSTGLSPCGRCDACILNRQAWDPDSSSVT
jgi:7-cyano-7-deazaguanine synthase